MLGSQNLSIQSLCLLLLVTLDLPPFVCMQHNRHGDRIHTSLHRLTFLYTYINKFKLKDSLLVHPIILPDINTCWPIQVLVHAIYRSSLHHVSVCLCISVFMCVSLSLSLCVGTLQNALRPPLPWPQIEEHITLLRRGHKSSRRFPFQAAMDLLEETETSLCFSPESPSRDSDQLLPYWSHGAARLMLDLVIHYRQEGIKMMTDNLFEVISRNMEEEGYRQGDM